MGGKDVGVLPFGVGREPPPTVRVGPEVQSVPSDQRPVPRTALEPHGGGPARGWIDAATFAGYRDRPSHFKPREDYERPQIQPQGEVLFQFVKATEPEGASVVGEKHPPCDDSEFPPDEDYVLFPSDGADRVTYRIPWERFGESQPAKVTVTLYSQSMTPFWLHQRFKLAKEAKDKGYATPQADRLHFLMSHLDLKGTKMEDYKLPLVTVSKPDKVP